MDGGGACNGCLDEGRVLGLRFLSCSAEGPGTPFDAMLLVSLICFVGVC